MRELYPARLTERYKIEVPENDMGFELLASAAGKRGFLISGGECDIGRMAVVLLDEFRGGKLGRVTLEARNPESPSEGESQRLSAGGNSSEI